MKVFLLLALSGLALAEVYFDEKFDDGDAWESRSIFYTRPLTNFYLLILFVNLDIYDL